MERVRRKADPPNNFTLRLRGWCSSSPTSYRIPISYGDGKDYRDSCVAEIFAMSPSLYASKRDNIFVRLISVYCSARTTYSMDVSGSRDIK